MMAPILKHEPLVVILHLSPYEKHLEQSKKAIDDMRLLRDMRIDKHKKKKPASVVP